MKGVRPMVGVTRWDRIRNEEIRRRADIEKTLAEKVDRRVLRWMRGAGQDRSRQLKWKVDWREKA